MRREGWQHGMVRSASILPPPCNPRHNGKMFDGFDVPPTARIHTKVSSKPTNHSKFTSKCRRARCQECHSHPISKSRSKAKGTYKLKACDVAWNHKLVSWRIVDVDKESMSDLRGASATEILSHLSGNCWYQGYEDDHDHNIEDDVEFGHGESYAEPVGLMIKEEEEEEEKEARPSSSSGDEDGGDMGFYVVGLAWEYLDEEDWLVVGENY